MAFFDKSVAMAAHNHFRLEPQLRQALEQQQFVNYHQPKIDLATGRIHGVEALIRWLHLQRGLVLPGEFVPALEATGRIRDVGRYILERAVADWASCAPRGLAHRGWLSMWRRHSCATRTLPGSCARPCSR